MISAWWAIFAAVVGAMAGATAGVLFFAALVSGARPVPPR